jgi:hypothetical protein
MFACILLVPLCFMGTDDTIALKEIGVSLPSTIGAIKYKSRQTFDQKALGYSVGYANKMCIITMIVYDHGQNKIPDGKTDPLVDDQMKRTIADMQTAETMGFYKNLQRIKEDLPLPKAIQTAFATAGFTFDVKGGACKSYVLLMGRNNYFLKVRITQYVVDNKTNDEEVTAFLETLAKAISAPAR